MHGPNIDRGARLATTTTILLIQLLAGCGGDKAADPPRATTLTVSAGSTRGIVGAPLTDAPSLVVLDQRNQPMAGVAVSISVSGGGTLAGAPTASGASAVSVGTWTLGPAPVPQTLTVSAGTLTPGSVTVTVDPGPPAAVNFTAPPPATARAGDSLAVRGSVVDRFGNPVAGVNLQSDFTRSGATATPTTLTTASAGEFQHTVYAGTVKGNATWTFAVPGNAAARATAPVRVLAAAASQISISGTLSGAAANRTAPPATLVVRDRFDNGSEDQVTFTVMAGGGTLAANVASPDATGTVSLPAWTMGRLAVPQVVRATSGTASIDISTRVATDFSVGVRVWGSPMTPDQEALFTNAAARWSGVILGDQPDIRFTNVSMSTYCGITGQPLLNEIVDDVLIYASIQPIDGAGGILAQAGPCLVRSAGLQLPVIGVMEFDSADLATLSANGSLERVIVHEMGHVLGIGSSYWGKWSYVSGSGGVDPQYQGMAALAACRALAGGGTLCARGVPVENVGGKGTYGSHWRTSTFQTELMVGYANPQMLLGPVTIGALNDIGYTVNADAAENYRFPGFGLIGPTRTLVRDEWERLPHRPVQQVTPDGTILPTLPIVEALRRNGGRR